MFSAPAFFIIRGGAGAGTAVDIYLGCDPETPGGSTVKQCSPDGGTCDSGYCIQLGIDKSAWFGTDARPDSGELLFG